MSKGIKRILRELIFRPINIIIYPILLFCHFFSWLTTSDDDWNGEEQVKGIKDYSREIIWWNL